MTNEQVAMLRDAGRLRRSPVLLMVFLLLLGCQSDYDPLKEVYTGQAACNRIIAISAANRSALPPSATNFYLFDGGTFAGCITYWSFDCSSSADCWAAIRGLRGPEKSKFQDWKPSRFSVVMQGPGFYFRQLATPLWDVNGIKHGAVYEYVKEHDGWLEYYAVDLDKLRVYYHHESGGEDVLQKTTSQAGR